MSTWGLSEPLQLGEQSKGSMSVSDGLDDDVGENDEEEEKRNEEILLKGLLRGNN